ncbi:MAG TPA: CHAD domain-containing protein, partial [Rhodocyclaceae bacterium]|nr:CHAD domain-containing protein [Rhodocyclaceae bacterium]
RRQGRKWLQTVKCAAPSTGGLTQRPEWEQPFDGAFDFSAIDAPRAAKWLRRCAADLVPVFSTRFRRETRRHIGADGASVLMMLDTGAVVAGEHSEPICELELELEHGRPLDLLLLASALAADVALLPSDLSKAERGYRLHQGLTDAPARAEPSSIAPTQTPLEAFRSLAFAGVRQWQANVLGAMGDPDPEFIHQLRVSQRRLRSLLRLFSPLLPAAFVADWSARLRDNARGFGEARDLDVLYDEILAPVAGLDAAGDAALARLQGLVHAARDAARVQVLARLDAAAQGRLLLDFVTALHALPIDDPAQDALTVFARRQLERLVRKVRRRHAAACAPDGAQALHALRIALKRLRYALEFFTPLLPAKASARYQKALVRAQDALGFINDVDVARGRLTQWAGEDAELRATAAYVCGWHAPRHARLRRRVLAELGALLERRPPWHR